jgi:type I restriction enzyme S subunit
LTPCVRLGDVVRVRHGGTPSKSNLTFWIGDIPWVSPKDFSGPNLRAPLDFISEDAVLLSAASVVPAGTILAVARSGVLAHSFPVALADRSLSFNQDIKALIPDQRKIDPRFLHHFLRSAERDIVHRGVKRGATVHSLQAGFLEGLSLRLPPLEEQRRIVDVLDRAAKVRRLRRQAQETARQIVPALFNKIFGDPSTNPMGWPVSSLETVANVASGVTKGRRLDGADIVDVPYMRVANVQDGFLDLGEVKTIQLRLSELDRFRLLPGDMLMTEGGDPDKLGRGAIWTGQIPYCAHQNHVFRVRADRTRILPHFLACLSGSAYGKGYFLRVAKRTTGIASINKTQLSAFPVLLPPVSLQEEFEQRVNNFTNLTGRQRAAEVACEAAAQAIQSRLFSA